MNEDLLARHRFAISVLLAGVVANLGDVWVTLQGWIVEKNPLVLALGPERWIAVKLVLLMGLVGSWYIARTHRYSTAVSFGPLLIGLFGLLGNAWKFGWYKTDPGMIAILISFSSVLIIATHFVSFPKRPRMSSRPIITKTVVVALVISIVLSGIPITPIPGGPNLSPVGVVSAQTPEWETNQSTNTPRGVVHAEEAGLVIVASGTDGVIAYDESTGAVEWTYTGIPNANKMAYSPGTQRLAVAISDSSNHDVTSLYVGNGSEVFAPFRPNGAYQITNLMMDPVNGTIYFQSGWDTEEEIGALTPDGTQLYENVQDRKGDMTYMNATDELVGVQGGELSFFYPENGNLKETITIPEQNAYDVHVRGKAMYVRGYDGTNYQVSKYYRNGTQAWSTDGLSVVLGISEETSNVYVRDGSDSSQVNYLHSSNGTIVDTMSLGTREAYDGAVDSTISPEHLFIAEMNGDVGRWNTTTTFQIESSTSGGTVNGTVKDQSGNGVPDGTVVEAYGVKTSNIDPETGQDLRERAEEIRNDLRNWDPSALGWNPDRQLAGTNGEFANTGEEYVAINSKSSWGLSGWADTPNLGQPMLVAPADKSFIAHVRDPTDTPTFQDGVDADLPGTVQDDTDIVFQQLDYSGDVVDTITVETSNTREAATLSNAEDHDYAEVNLPAGFYRVKAENSSYSYPMAVAPDRNPEKLTKAITQKLETKANQKAQQAARVQNLLDQNKVVELTTTTYTKNGERGHFNFSSVPSDVDVVAVQAYSPALDKYQIEDPQNASIQDLREIAALEDYNSSFYITPVARDVSVPSQNVTIRVREVSATPYMDPGRFQNKSEWIQELLENQTFTDAVKDRLEMNEQNRTKVLNQLSQVREENQQLQERYETLLEQREERTGVDEVTNETEIRLLRQSIRDLQGELKAEDAETSYGDGTVSATIPWSGDIAEDAVSVTAHFPGSGESVVVPDEYVSVNKRAGQGDVLKVTDYPVPENTGITTFGVTVNGEDGEALGNTKVPAMNPGYSGKVLSLESVSVSTLYPGPSEQVSISLNPEDESAAVQSVNATVDGPEGAVNVTVTDSEKVQFTTNGAGTYYVSLEVTDRDGSTWSEGLAIKAGSESINQPASVRARDGFTGEFAVASDGLNGGSMKTAGGAVQASAIAPADNVPSTVHFYTSQVSNNFQNTNVRVLKQSGDGEPETVRKHTKVFVHTAKLSDNAVVYREGSEPLKVGGETAYGQITCAEGSDGCTVRTYTEGDGSVSITVNNNPNVVESTLHWVSLNSPVDIPVLTLGFSPVDVSGVGSGFAPVFHFHIPLSDLAGTASLASATPSPDALAAASGGVPA